MSLQCKILDQSSHGIFFEKPSLIEVNEEEISNYTTSQKIEVLIQELKEKGPFIAVGTIKPDLHQANSFEVKEKYCGKDIYGSTACAAKKVFPKQSYLLILGAKKKDNNEYVYFTTSEDVTNSRSSYIRKHKPSNTDEKIYTVSYKTFQADVSDVYPSKTLSEISPCTIFSITSENEYVKKLMLLPLNSILDMSVGQAECKAIGQLAFDEFKNNADGSSLAGQKAVVEICNLLTTAKDGVLRKYCVERAWDKIGDDEWRWQA